MYQVYIKKEKGFMSKDLIGEFNDIEKAYEKVSNELEKNKDIKYIIEETTGHVNIYGDLEITIIEEN